MTYAIGDMVAFRLGKARLIGEVCIRDRDLWGDGSDSYDIMVCSDLYRFGRKRSGCLFKHIPETAVERRMGRAVPLREGDPVHCVWREGGVLEERIGSIAELADPLGDGSRFVLSHYPMLDWDRMYHGSYMLHGHIHSWPAGDAAKFVGPRFVTHEHGLLGYNGWNRANGIRRYDVGVDANGYAPVSMDDIVAFFEGMELACLGAKEGEWA